MSVKTSDWIYLAAGFAGTWWLTKEQNGKNPMLEMLRTALVIVRWLERTLSDLDNAIMHRIDKELDLWV